MLAMRCTPNIFLISVYVCLEQDIWYVKVGVLKNRKQFFLSVTYSVFIGAGVRYLFIFISHLVNHKVPMKHAREKNFGLTKIPTRKKLDPRNTHEIPTRKNLDSQNTHKKKSGPTKYPREKISDSRNSHVKNFRTHEGTMARWHETHESHDGTRPTGFSTLIFLQPQSFLANFDKVAPWEGTRIIAKENSKFIVENVHYDGKLKVKLLIYFTNWTEVYPEFDRYLWIELKEEMILIYYLHFIPLHGIGIKICNYYSVLPELKLIGFSWICGCFPRKFALNKFVRSLMSIQLLFWSEFFKLKFGHFFCELIESFWKVWTILFWLLVQPVLPFTSVLIFAWLRSCLIRKSK